MLSASVIDCAGFLKVSSDGPLPPPNAYTKVTLFKGTFINYQARFQPSAVNTVLVTYNGGFGNFVESGRFDLLVSWHDDLRAIVNSGIPAFFTQANDYADLAGETALMAHVFGASFVVLPTQNPFSAASHLSEPDKPEAWACANHSFYGIQGCDQNRVVRAEVHTPEGKRKLCHQVLEAVNAGCDLPMLKKMTVHLCRSCAQPAAETMCPPENDMVNNNSEAEQQLEESENGENGLPTPSYRVESASESWQVIVSLPLLDSSDGIDIELSTGLLDLCFSTVYSTLSVAHPAISEDDEVTAKFDRGRQELCVCQVPQLPVE